MKTVSVHCLLLCAGLGRRMKNTNKLFLPLNGSSVLATTSHEISQAGFDSVTCVTGFEFQRVEAEIQAFGFKKTHNPGFESGMHSSIRAGVSVLKHEKGFVAICLSDQPFLKSSDYKKLIAAAQANPQAKLISPMFENQRGNPVLISLELAPVILSHPDNDRGCFYLFGDYPDEVVSVQMEDRKIFMDLDTPEDYQCLKTSISS